MIPLLALAGLAGAQGSDNCSSAQPIAGEGTFAFNNSSANTDGVSAGCSSNPNHDVWFLWTAPSTDSFTVETCGLSNLDTMLAAYNPGTCPPTSVLACVDDSCGLQTRIAFQAIAGNTYLLRVGVFPGTSGGTGSISIARGNGGCSNPSVGPDVIVGDLYDITRWGTLGGVTSYSLGTYSCNIGDTVLLWISGNNQHPVIGQNIYRLENGRFEQLGLSWLKHGFTALTDDLCCVCNPPGTGSRLGVGCADPYSAGLNGSQGGLGPRSEVNAYTGSFLYPYGHQGQTGDVLYKRIQVANSDIDPAQHPTAIFYGEGQYVTPDDAAAGNQNNNASYRRLNVGSQQGGGWNLLLAGTTQRTDPAIRAWQAADPSVRIEVAQGTNDGLILVGSRATDNGNGTWHYEYAIQNLNSDRCTQAFTVPVGSGVSLTNIGFHDVNYHSGEPYSGTDWTATVFPDRIEWATETFAQNVNANALRWGTLYNFRFDANAAPQDISADLTYFKPGSPNSIGAIVSAPVSNGCTITPYCVTSSNSVGSGTLMSSTGTTSIAANDLNLASSGSPSNQFGIFYYGPSQTQVAFGNGFKCVGGSLTRLPVVQIDTFGVAVQPIDYNNLPPSGQINAGETHNFQFWYRDPMGGGAAFNLSDALSITFCP